jgi:hypothetical protein
VGLVDRIPCSNLKSHRGSEGQCVTGSYQNYQNGAVSNQLTDGERGIECVGGDSKSVDV